MVKFPWVKKYKVRNSRAKNSAEVHETQTDTLLAPAFPEMEIVAD